MMHVFDIAGFKKYLLIEGSRFRIDGLSVWFNSIPIPVDLFDIFFEAWPRLFRNYLDHLMAALILEETFRVNPNLALSISLFPDPDVIKERKTELYQGMNAELIKNLKFRQLAKELAAILGVEHYEIDISTLMECASVRGKKYSRLYLPKSFRKNISDAFPYSLTGIGISNGDMFGNILADELKLYRSGFSDALAGFFNKLLDYKIVECSGLIKAQSSTVLNFGRGEGSNSHLEFIQQKTTDGSLWEPYFDGEIKVKLNPSHPHFLSIAKCSNPEAVLKILSVMSQLEMNCVSDKELKILEVLRAKISRVLWMED